MVKTHDRGYIWFRLSVLPLYKQNENCVKWKTLEQVSWNTWRKSVAHMYTSKLDDQPEKLVCTKPKYGTNICNRLRSSLKSKIRLMPSASRLHIASWIIHLSSKTLWHVLQVAYVTPRAHKNRQLE